MERTVESALTQIYRKLEVTSRAEAVARAPKRWTTYRLPVAGRGWTVQIPGSVTMELERQGYR